MRGQRREFGGGEARRFGPEGGQHARCRHLAERGHGIAPAVACDPRLLHRRREAVVAAGIGHPDPCPEPFGRFVDRLPLVGRHDDDDAVVRPAEEHRAATLVRAQLEEFRQPAVAGGGGVGEGDDDGGGRERSPRVARDAARECRVVREQRLDEARPQRTAGTAEALVLLERESGHGDDRRDHSAPLLVELAGGDRDDSAEMPSSAQGLQRERPSRDPQRRCRPGAPAEDRGHLVPERPGGLGIQIIGGMLAHELSRRVVQPDPGAQLARQFGEGGAESVGTERCERDRPLRRERPGASGEGLGGDGLRVGAGDRDERRAVRDLEQRQARVAAGGGEFGRDAVAHDLRAESEARDAPRGQPLHVLGGRCGVAALELGPRREQDLTVGEERRRVGEVAAVHPAHRALEHRRFAVLQAEVQIRTTQQCAESGGVGGVHGAPAESAVLVVQPGIQNVHHGGCRVSAPFPTLAT